tara:strand:+ start:176 stop:1324 length:1149 start_codon:yes stop_codon:yes gene_type:complete
MRYVTLTLILISLLFLISACDGPEYDSGDATTDMVSYLQDCYQESLENINTGSDLGLGLNSIVIERNIIISLIKSIQSGNIKPEEKYLGDGIWEVELSTDLYSDYPFIDPNVPLVWTEDHFVLYAKDKRDRKFEHIFGPPENSLPPSYILEELRDRYYPGHALADYTEFESLGGQGISETFRGYDPPGITVVFDDNTDNWIVSQVGGWIGEGGIEVPNWKETNPYINELAVKSKYMETRSYSRNYPPISPSHPFIRSITSIDGNEYSRWRMASHNRSVSRVSQKINEYVSNTEQISRSSEEIYLVSRGESSDAYPYLIHEIDFKWKIYENAKLIQDNPNIINNTEIISISNELYEFDPQQAKEDTIRNGPAILWNSFCVLGN